MFLINNMKIKSKFILFTVGITSSISIGYYFYKKINNNLNNKIDRIKNVNKKLWIETDLEPDDVLAIDILKKKNYDISVYVCGEGDIDNKMNRLLYYYKNIYTDFSDKFIKGIGSNKDFPEPYTEPINSKNIINNINYIDNLKEFIIENNTIIIIKPPRELYQAYLNNREETKKIMSNINCYMYGSFNLRSLNVNDLNDLKEFLLSFKNLYIFETYYAFGNDNTVNINNYLNFHYLKKNKNFDEITKQWNEYCIKDCIDTCNSIINKNNKTIISLNNLPDEITANLNNNDKEKYNRNFKCYESIKIYNDNQFVMADVGLALCFNNNKYWTPVNINFDNNGYTILTKTNKSNVYTVLNSNDNYLKNSLLDELTDLYVKI